MKTFELEPIEKAPREELRRLQLERLQWSLKHAYENVAQFRKKFDAAGVKPQDCRMLQDLRRSLLVPPRQLRSRSAAISQPKDQPETVRDTA